MYIMQRYFIFYLHHSETVQFQLFLVSFADTELLVTAMIIDLLKIIK